MDAGLRLSGLESEGRAGERGAETPGCAAAPRFCSDLDKQKSAWPRRLLSVGIKVGTVSLSPVADFGQFRGLFSERVRPTEEATLTTWHAKGGVV